MFAAAASAAYAAPPAAAPPGFSSKEPIEINSDMLEVHQTENEAIFTGNVIAVQGTTRLKSDKMIVHYLPRREGAPSATASSGGGKPDAAPAPQAAPAIDSAGRVERIEVEGSVLLATPTETASGDNGTYDVPKQKITLVGNVVLTRGQNVLKGDTAVYDFAVGKTVINSAFQGEKPAHPNGRVRALFVPGGDEGGAAAAKGKGAQ